MKFMMLFWIMINVLGLKIITPATEPPIELQNLPSQFGKAMVIETPITEITEDSVIVVSGVAFKLDPQCEVIDQFGRKVSPWEIKPMLPALVYLSVQAIGKSVTVKQIKILKKKVESEVSPIPLKEQFRSR